ncbi:hypothetical protein [Methylobacterium sp. A54F]
MSEAESLRMVAEVTDKFSGPLRNLRAQLQGMSRDGAAHAEPLTKGFNRIESAARSAGQTTTTVLNPALAAIGVTSLGVTAALVGVGSALRSFGGSVSALAQLGRETNMAAGELRTFQALAGKFGISGDAAAAAAKTFAGNMRDIRKGVGETMGFLQSQSPVVAQFALRLKGSKNNDEARRMAEEFLEQIPDSVDRQRFAEKLFGDGDLGRLGDKHLGSIRKLRAEIDKALGPLDPAAVKSAEDFDRAMSSLRTTMTKLGTAIATEAMPYASAMTTWLNEVASGARQDITAPLRQGLKDIGTELNAINWTEAGKTAGDFLRGSTALAGGLSSAIRDVARTIRALNEGKVVDALRTVTGGEGSLARRLAPREGDDEIAASEQVDRLRKLLDVSREASQHVIGRAQIGAGLLDDPEKVARDLEAAEARLKALKGRTSEQRSSDFSRQQSEAALDASTAPLRERLEAIQKRVQNADALIAGGTATDKQRSQAEDMRREMGRLTDELKRLREGMSQQKREGEATVQKQSFDDSGSVPAAGLIQKASYGSPGAAMVGIGRLLGRRKDGIYAPGGGGQGRSPAGQMGREFQQFLDERGIDMRALLQPRVGDQAELDMRGRSPAWQAGHALRRYLQGRGGSGSRIPPMQLRPGGPGEQVRRSLRGEGGPLAQNYPEGLAEGIQQSAKDLGVSAEDLATVISYETAGTFDKWKRGPTTKWGTHRGLIQWGEPQARQYGVTADMSAGEQMKAVTRYLRDRGVRPGMGIHQIYGAINAGGVTDWHLQQRDAAAGGAPGTVRDKVDYQMGPHRRKGLALLGAAGDRQTAANGEQADGEGFSARMRAMRNFEGTDFAGTYKRLQAKADERGKAMTLGSSAAMTNALRSGVIGGPKIENNGSVTLHVDKAGPDARVRMGSSGELFRTVKLNRGKAMAEASQTD